MLIRPREQDVKLGLESGNVSITVCSTELRVSSHKKILSIRNSQLPQVKHSIMVSEKPATNAAIAYIIKVWRETVIFVSS